MAAAAIWSSAGSTPTDRVCLVYDLVGRCHCDDGWLTAGCKPFISSRWRRHRGLPPWRLLQAWALRASGRL